MSLPDCRDLEAGDIDKDFLTPIVRNALKDDSAEVLEFNCQTILGGLEAGSQVIRYQGKARTKDQVTPWSLIQKSIAYSAEHDDPGGTHYWKREALGYQSGLIEKLPGGVTAPRCYAVTERPGKGIWIWLEEVQDEVGTKWPLEQYREAARLLGQMNGAYLARHTPARETLAAKGLGAPVHRKSSTPGRIYPRFSQRPPGEKNVHRDRPLADPDRLE